MQVKIDWNKKTATITVPLMESPVASSTGNTESFVSIRNQAVGVNAPDGRPVKMTLQVYVKPKVA